ncbi:MAG TPA: CaiB/BaiF CoA-transferase family protein [Candidatus Dormibacteraeota bacterium]|nr:CaiB/BaiF CoA-transferase family protein [Candidatus Dormibacteraeota bacterium]
MALPLRGVLVLALEQAVSGPLASRLLLDQGARVVKIERPGPGDFARHYEHHSAGVSSYFAWLNHGKESVALDLKTPHGRDIAHALAEQADVVVQNYAPGAASRLGLGPRQLRRRRPELICGSISGYGDRGPYTERKAYDLLVQAEAGVIAVTGEPGRLAKAGVSLCDIASGTALATGILAALVARGAGGGGAAVSVSMFEATLDWTAPTLGLYLSSGVEPQPVGLHHLHAAPYGPFPCGDGAVLVLCAQHDREWRDLCVRALDRPDLAADERFVTTEGRMRNRAGLHAALEAALSTDTAERWEERIVAAGLACARLRSVSEVANHPVVRERGLLQEVRTELGTALTPQQAIRSSAGRLGGGPRIPSVGEHTDRWLRRLGYTAAERRDLYRTGAAAAPRP